MSKDFSRRGAGSHSVCPVPSCGSTGFSFLLPTYKVKGEEINKYKITKAIEKVKEAKAKKKKNMVIHLQ